MADGNADALDQMRSNARWVAGFYTVATIVLVLAAAWWFL